MEEMIIKPYAFKIIEQPCDTQLEEVMNVSFEINDDNSYSYSEGDFGLKEDSSFQKSIRKDSGNKILKVNILQTYYDINPEYSFSLEKDDDIEQRKCLTSPEEPASNGDKDNIESNLIVYTEDIINGFTIIDLIGQGVSGQVFKVIENETGNKYAMKIIRNKKAYINHSLIELKIIKYLNDEIDKNDQYHIIRVTKYFFYYQHLCIVFELLNQNLYQLLAFNDVQGISLRSIRCIIKQVLEAIEQIHKAGIIHCDIKPENVLLDIKESQANSKGNVSIKVIDFGSACYKKNIMFTYIQSRFYRAPEVILGHPYTNAIDIWSIGLVAVELFLGVPLFPGKDEYDQLHKIISVLGDIPDYMMMNQKCKNLEKYYKFNNETRKYSLLTPEEYYKLNPPSEEDQKDLNDYKIPFKIKTLDDLLTLKNKNQKRGNDSFSSSNTISDELQLFVHFLKGMIVKDPKGRWSAKQCLMHPFITKEKVDMSFINMVSEDSSQQLYLSSIQQGNNLNNKMNNSMIYNVPRDNIFSNSFDVGANNNNISNTSNYCFQPNLNNIHMNWMKQNFPFAMVDQCNLRDTNPNGIRKNIRNNTFMMTSFERIHPNASSNNASFSQANNSTGSPLMMNSGNNSFGNAYDMPNHKAKQMSLFGKHPNAGNFNSNYNGNQQFMSRKNKKGKTTKANQYTINNMMNFGANANYNNMNNYSGYFPPNYMMRYPGLDNLENTQFNFNNSYMGRTPNFVTQNVFPQDDDVQNDTDDCRLSFNNKNW